MINVLIADDEKHARDRLKTLLQKYDIFSLDYEAKDGDEVIQLIISKNPDVVFLDINMPGVSVFNSLSSLKNPPIIIFQTAYSEYAVDAYGINALDYLVKPISEERLAKTVEKIKNALAIKSNKSDVIKKNNNLEKISVRHHGNIKIISLNDIYKITFEEGFSFIYTYEGRFLADKYLNYYDEKLKDKGFFRVSRNDIVNIKNITLIHPMFKGNYVIELNNGAKIKLSRRRAKTLKKIINF